LSPLTLVRQDNERDAQEQPADGRLNWVSDADGREQRLLVVVEPASCSSRGGSLPVQNALTAHSSSACLEVALHASRAPFVMENACTGNCLLILLSDIG